MTEKKNLNKTHKIFKLCRAENQYTTCTLCKNELKSTSTTSSACKRVQKVKPEPKRLLVYVQLDLVVVVVVISAVAVFEQ